MNLFEFDACGILLLFIYFSNILVSFMSPTGQEIARRRLQNGIVPNLFQ